MMRWRADTIIEENVVGYEGRGVRTIDSDPRILAICCPKVVEGEIYLHGSGADLPDRNFEISPEKGPRECLEGRNVPEGTL
jgi:hypothetical protein